MNERMEKSTREKTGVERLRSLCADWAEDASSVTALEDRLAEIADQIEREHADELAEAKRGGTLEASKAAERLRGVRYRACGRSAFDLLYGACLGPNMPPPPNEGDAFATLRSFLIDMVEYGGRAASSHIEHLEGEVSRLSSSKSQSVDVSALLALADDLDESARQWDGDTSLVPCSSYCGAYRGMAGIIREAVDGDPTATTDDLDSYLRRDARRAAADWVEANGRLDAVNAACAETLYMQHTIARACGIDPAGLSAVETEQAIIAELGKRLMPAGMEWPRFEDGEHVMIGDEFWWGCRSMTCEAVKFGDGFALLDADCGPSAWYGYVSNERVKRPKTKVLGADCLPIEDGQTVYLDAEHADMAGIGPIESNNECGLLGVASHAVLRVGRIDGEKVRFDHSYGPWCPASWLTHTPPDTQERIDADAALSSYAYLAEREMWDERMRFTDEPKKTWRERMRRAKWDDLKERQRDLDAEAAGGAR